MKAIFGKKMGMMRFFAESGESVPVTVLELGPNVVYQLKTPDKDGYSAIQVGFGAQKGQRVNRALTGHFAQAKKGLPLFVSEIRFDKDAVGEKKKVPQYELGQEIRVADLFAVGSKVDVVGTSIGKGFAGVVKRHHMAGFSATHGTHEYFRHAGSIGCRKFPGRVFKNKRMSGHMGGDRVMQQGLEVVGIKPEEHLVLIRGSVPGPKGGVVFVRESVKA